MQTENWTLTSILMNQIFSTSSVLLRNWPIQRGFKRLWHNNGTTYFQDSWPCCPMLLGSGRWTADYRKYFSSQWIHFRLGVSYITEMDVLLMHQLLALLVLCFQASVKFLVWQIGYTHTRYTYGQVLFYLFVFQLAVGILQGRFNNFLHAV